MERLPHREPMGSKPLVNTWHTLLLCFVRGLRVPLPELETKMQDVKQFTISINKYAGKA